MDQLERKFALMKSVLEYVDVSGNLEKIKQSCEQYRKLKVYQPQDALVYIFKLTVSPLDIAEIDVSLGNELLSSPAKVISIFQELLPDSLTMSQISVELRLSLLPAVSSYDIKCCRDLSLSCDRTAGFVRLVGIVIGLTAASKYTQCTRYICKDEDCEGNKGNHFIRVHTPGASEYQTIRNDFTCLFCWKTLVEVKTCRSLADRIVADFIPVRVFNPQACVVDGKSGFREQAIPVYVRDDLVQQVEIGQQYEVVGTIRKDYHGDTVIMTVEANNIKSVSPIPTVSFQTLPKLIMQLYEDRKCSPWSFPMSLAYMFAGRICPPGTYLKFKLTLLLCLASLNMTQEKSPLHILSVGQDTSILHKLMVYAQMFSQRCCVHSTGKHLSGKVTTDKYQGASYFVEGGSLLLARNGICYLGDLGKFKKSTCDNLQTSNNKMLIDIGSKYTGGLPQQLDTQLQCHVWSYMDSVTQNKKSTTLDDVFTGCKVGDVSKTLLDAFSIIQFVDCDDSTTNEDIALQCAYQTLVSAVDDNEEFAKDTLSDDDFKQFLWYCQNVSVQMTEEAERIINGYYVASRKARSTGTSVSTVPVTSLHTLYSLARSHAKLNLQCEVTEADALMAVRLYEETITARFGYSVLSVQPMQHIASDQIQHSLGSQNDKYMKQFHIQLLRFCTNQVMHEE